MNTITGGEVYAWGSNNYGQLGIGHICEKISKPSLVNSIAGIPIAFIACGCYHSFVISKYIISLWTIPRTTM